LIIFVCKIDGKLDFELLLLLDQLYVHISLSISY